jgi:hypothetical protein
MTNKTHCQLTVRLLKYFLTRFGEARCERCGAAFKVGDRILCKPTSTKRTMEGSYRTRHFHEDCYEDMFT